MAAPVFARGKRRLHADINVVPYIDVMLVLLVIFMVTAPLLTQGIDVELPQAQAEPIANQEEPVTLTVDARGRYFLDIGTDTRKPLADDEVVRRVAIVLRQKPQTMILVRADHTVPYGAVVQGMSLLQRAGASKIGFVTQPPAADGGARPHG
ncbi:MAG: protein TolR [Sinobacteraceae bacterium]|nr:protein TolR [Nevskia sp.]MDI3259787.1 protein TolR [Nevskiaceae bacterium]